MTKLLISVQDLAEAHIAFEAGAAIIDVKDPGRGSLGAGPAAIRRAIGSTFGDVACLSAACGELLEWNPVDPRVAVDDWRGYRYAKLGLSGVISYAQWRTQWLSWRNRLPGFVEPVMVVYADGDRCDAPTAEETLQFAAECGCRMAMVDTFDKHGPGLTDLWTTEGVRLFVERTHSLGMACVLAGSLTLDDVPALRTCAADLLAVRGAVCDDDANAAALPRTRRLAPEKIAAWRHALAGRASSENTQS
ncbi:MAG: (5-formylfuran-3-yl)methyl phosphate synthase [Pirellulales bacterium]